MKFLLLSAVLLASTCQTGPFSPQPPPDPVPFPEPAGGASPSQDAGPPAPVPDTTPGVRLACDALTTAQCPEGGPTCYRVLQHVVDSQLTPVPLGCLAGAHSKADVHACGPFVACP